jgi:N utilization substance protein B
LAELYATLLQQDLERLANSPSDLMDPAEADAPWLKAFYLGLNQHRSEYPALLGPYLQNWKWDRLAKIDQLILVQSLHELMHCPYIPVKVTLNEALELAKQYSTDKSSLFINGVLDAVIKAFKAKDKIVKTGKGLLETTLQPLSEAPPIEYAETDQEPTWN